MTVRARLLLSVALVGLALCAWFFTRSGTADPAAAASSRDARDAPPPPLTEGGSPGLAGASGPAPSPPAPPSSHEEIAAQPGVPSAEPGAPLEPAHLTGVVRDAITKAPLFGARILIGVNEISMHRLRVVADPPMQARTDAEGRFSIDVPVPAEGWTIRIDAMSPGRKSLSGALTGGAGDALQVPVKPGDARSVELELARGFGVAGVVRDELGNPVEDVEIEAREEDSSFYMTVALTRTDRDGRFEVYDYDVDGDPDHRGPWGQARLHLDHVDFVPLVTDDLRPKSEAERTSLDLRMMRGLDIEGLVRTPEGGAAPDLLVEAIHETMGWRRSVIAARDGGFRLRGVPRGAVTLRAADYVRRLVATARVALETEGQRVSLDLKPVRGGEPRAPVRLLGLDLLDLTEEERIAFGLDEQCRVLVMGVRDDLDALGGGFVLPGDCLFRLADLPVRSAREFAERLLAEAETWTARGVPSSTPSVSLFYRFRREGGFDGTRGQGVELSTARLAEVRAFLAAHPK